MLTSRRREREPSSPGFRAAGADLRRSLAAAVVVAVVGVVLPLVAVSGAAAAPGTVSVSVYEDFNANGVRDSAFGQIDVGLQGIDVVLTCADGTQSAGVTDASGVAAVPHSCPDPASPLDPSASQVRVEVTWDGSLAPFAGLRPAPLGPDNGGTVQFMAAGTQSVVVGLSRAADYLGSGAELVTATYRNGVAGGADGSYKSLLGVPWVGGSERTLDVRSNTGAVWGIAYSRTREVVFSSALVKRHTGLGPGGIDAIYATPVAGGASSVVANVGGVGSVPNDATRGLGAVSSPSLDIEVYGKVAKAGIGDLDLSDDESELWYTNLFDGQLYRLGIGAPSGPLSPGTPQSVGMGSASCSNGVLRPWAVKYHGGRVYVGAVCSAENGGSRSDLVAHVFVYDPAAGTWSSVMDPVTLDFRRGRVNAWDGSIAPGEETDYWNPWSDDYTDVFEYSGSQWRYPQPVLSDIDFDVNGVMLLGFIDRFGHQGGTSNYRPVNPPGGLTSVNAGMGDLWLACWNYAAERFVLESNGSCGVPGASNRRGPTGGAGNSQGPGGGEFIFEDDLDGGAIHEETGDGGVALVPGSGVVATTATDPDDIWSGGLKWYSLSTGTNTRNWQVYGNAQDVRFFGKAQGMGDLELLADLAPTEVGNRVWHDLDGDGLQDAGEPGIAGVEVTLTIGATSYAATTDGDGQYGFSSRSSGTASGVTYGVPLGAGVSFTVSGPTSVTVGGSSLRPTVQNAGGGTDPDPASAEGAASSGDRLDSDVDPATGVSSVFTIAASGDNQHTFDVGYRSVTGSIEVTKTVVPATAGDLSAAPGSWEFTLASQTPGCDLPAGLTNPDTLPPDGSGSVVWSGLLVDDGAGTACEYAVSETAVSGWTGSVSPTGPHTVTDGGTTQVGFTNTEVPVYDLALAKVASSGVVSANGEEVTFTLRVQNQGNVTSGDFTVTDTLPSGMGFVSASDGGAETSPGSGVVTWSLSGVAPGGFRDISVTAAVDDVRAGPFRNWAEISADGGDDVDSSPDADTGSDQTLPNDAGAGAGGYVSITDLTTIETDGVPANDEDDNDDAVVGAQVYDLALAKIVAPGAVSSVGDTVTWTVRVHNQGTVDSGPFTVTDTLPASMAYVAGSARVGTGQLGFASASESAGVLTVAFTDAAGLAPGAYVDVSFDTSLADYAVSSFRNWAEISSDSGADADSTPDTTTGSGSTLPNDAWVGVTDLAVIGTDGQPATDEDDNDDAAVTLTPVFDLALVKLVDSAPDPLDLGSQVAYRIVVANQGNRPASFTVRDTIPEGMVLVTGSAAGDDLGTGVPIDADESAAPPVSASCGGSPPLGCVPSGGSGSVSWDVGSPTDPLLPGEEVELVVTLEVFAFDGANGAITEFRNRAEIVADNSAVYGVADEDSTPDGDATNDPVIDRTQRSDIGIDVEAGDEDDHDIAVLAASPEFDLALRKTLAVGQASVVHAGDTVRFTVTVFNQGSRTATGIQVIDHLPTGWSLDTSQSPGWLAGAGDTATYVVPGALPPGASWSFQVAVVVPAPSPNDSAAAVTSAGTYENLAEIAAARDARGQAVTDTDSTPNSTPGDDGTPVDDEIDAAPPVDEDDHDPAAVTVRTLSLGNRVWLDVDNDGVHEFGEPGIDGVTVELYAADATGAPTGAVVDTQVTAGGGYFFFSELVAGDYVVVVPASMFDDAADPLWQLYSSTGDTPSADVDLVDDGIDPVAAGGAVVSAPVALTHGGEPTAEPDKLPGHDAPVDEDANTTVDFGFTGLTVGNRVWLDTGIENGRHDSGEPGVGGVPVQLWAADGSGPIGAAPLATTVTDAQGFYLFSGLAAGDYVLRIPASAFAPGGALAGYRSSEGNDTTPWPADLVDVAPDPDTDIDTDDNGDGGRLGPIDAEPVTLTHGAEPTDESQVPTPAHDGPEDRNANVTVDFGFVVAPSLSLGNRVWADHDNDGVHDVGEPGIAGVSVNLYRDAGGDGIPDTEMPFQQTFTDADGYWLFTGLDEGGYLAEIPTSQYDAGAPLEGWWSSDGNSPAPDPDDDADGDDNGADPADPATTPVRSATITLSAYDEPRAEVDIGPQADPASDDNSNLTVDFGFYQLSVGNRVWADYDDDGVQDLGEPGIEGVEVELRAGGAPESATPLARTSTDADGYWLFTGLAAGTYVVEIPGTQFDPGSPLSGWWSSTGDDQGVGVDQTDQGIDPAQPGDPVRSGPISLTATGPMEEPDKPVDGSHDTPLDAAADTTVDFGFYQLSLGNRVWADLDGDGVQTTGEPGIEGVRVELYVDADADNVADSAAPLAQTSTDAEGYYRFGGLAATTYLVAIPATAWDPGGPLEHWASSLGASDADGDVDLVDDGVDPAVSGAAVWSAPVTLTAAGEPVDESDVPDAVFDAPTDASANVSVDFGFYPLAEIGDRVWVDADRDGIQDAGEAGVAGVTVILYDAAGHELDTTVTDLDGIYLFADLPPGEYQIGFDLTTLPDNHLVTSRDSGTDDARDSDADATTGRTIVTSLVIGESDRSWDLGIHVREIDLALTKTLVTATGTAPDTAVWNLVVTNNGPDRAPGPITVVDDLPAGLTHRSATGTGWDCSASGQTVTCARSEGLDPGETAPALTIVTTVDAPPGATITNNAQVLSGQTETTLVNNSSGAGLAVPGDAGGGGGGGLAYTGAAIATLLGLAAALLVAGTVIVALTRRRRHTVNP